MSHSRLGDAWVVSWPEGSKVPRWVRDWRGRVRRPPLQIRLMPKEPVEYQVALYEGLLRQWVVVITWPGRHSGDANTPLTTGVAVRTRSYLRPFGRRGYRATIRNHMYPRGSQDPAGLSKERKA